jgi:hypothetical protein
MAKGTAHHAGSAKGVLDPNLVDMVVDGKLKWMLDHQRARTKPK